MSPASSASGMKRAGPYRGIVVALEALGDLRAEHVDFVPADDFLARTAEQRRHLRIAGPVDAGAILQPYQVGAVFHQRVQLGLFTFQFGGAQAHRLAHRSQPDQQHQYERAERQQGIHRIPCIAGEGERAAHPFVVQRRDLGRRDPRHAAFDEGQRGGVALAYGTVQVTMRGFERLDIAAVQAAPVQAVFGRQVFAAEQLDAAICDGIPQGVVRRKITHARHAGTLHAFATGVAGLDAYLESLQAVEVVNAFDGRVGVDRHMDLGIRLGKIEAGEPGWGDENVVDDVRLATLQRGLGLGPVDTVQFDLHAGLLLPQAPDVHGIAFQLTLGIANRVGRIVLVHDHAQRRRCREHRGEHRAEKQNGE